MLMFSLRSREEEFHLDPKSISNLVLVSQQVNNATARVMTNKKAANPYTNGNGTRKGGEVSSEPGIPGKGAGFFSSRPLYRLGVGRCSDLGEVGGVFKKKPAKHGFGLYLWKQRWQEQHPAC